MSKREIVQICIVVIDLDKSMEKYWKILCIGPWDVYTFNQETVRDFAVEGVLVDDFEYKLAVAMLGEIQFELIQPVRNVPIYENFLREKGEIVHHIKEKVEDDEIEETVEKFKKKGVGVTVSGKFGEDVFLYLDTEPTLGIIYEIGNCGKIPAPERRYPPEAKR